MAAQLLSERQHVTAETDVYQDHHQAIEEAVGRLACGELIVAHNATVYAVVGNAHSPTLLEDIQTLKGDPGRMTVGWTTPFRRAMHVVDAEAVADEELRRLITDPQTLSRRYAALGFVCMPIQESALADSLLPACMVSQELKTVQPYSPTGNDFTSRLIRTAQARGVEVVMTSANVHGDAEIVLPEEARAFAESAPTPLFVLEDGIVAKADSVPLGSYPIVAVRDGKVAIVRPGCFTPEVVGRLFDGYEVDLMPEGQRVPQYPENVFGMEDLDDCYQEYDLKGELLRLGILATLGWQADARAILAERLVDDNPVLL